MEPKADIGPGFAVLKLPHGEQELPEIRCLNCFEVYLYDIELIIMDQCPACGQKWINS